MSSLNPASPAHKFRMLSEELSSFIEQEGWSVRPYGIESLPFFQQLVEEEQAATVVRLTQYLEICRKVYSKGRRLKEMPYFVETALDYYGYQISPQAIEQLHEDESRVVEFYCRSHTQFFRTLNFFEFASYTIEDIYCRQWVHLYQRDVEVSQRVFTKANEVLSGAMKEPVIITEKQEIRERVSLERLQLFMNRLYLEPLLHKDGIAGLVAIEDCAWS